LVLVPTVTHPKPIKLSVPYGAEVGELNTCIKIL
jgi:hypothetical protein